MATFLTIIRIILMVIFGVISLALNVVVVHVQDWYFKIRKEAHPAIFILVSILLIPFLIIGSFFTAIYDKLENPG